MHTTRPGPVDTGAILVGASALLVVVGAAAAWITLAGDGIVTGIALVESGNPAVNGLVTVALASVATLVALFFPHSTGAAVLTAIAGLAIELVAVAIVVAPTAALGPLAASAEISVPSAAIGVYVTLLGGLGILLGSVVSHRR